MKLTLDDIDTTKFIFNPKSKSFVEDMQKEELLKFELEKKTITQKAALTYICIMYDVNSKLLEKEKDIIKRKEMAGIICGFPYTDNTGFNDYTINLMSGKSAVFNDAIAHYLHLSNSIFLQRLASLEYNYEKLIRESFDKYDSKTETLIKTAFEGIIEMRDRIFGGHEAHEMHVALSKKVRKISDELRIEHINEKFEKDELVEYNPFEFGYKIDLPKYIGDVPPKEH